MKDETISLHSAPRSRKFRCGVSYILHPTRRLTPSRGSPSPVNLGTDGNFVWQPLFLPNLRPSPYFVYIYCLSLRIHKALARLNLTGIYGDKPPANKIERPFAIPSTLTNTPCATRDRASSGFSPDTPPSRPFALFWIEM